MDYESGKYYQHFNRQEIDSLPASQKYDLLPRIDSRYRGDMAALRSWVEDLRKRRIPFVVKSYPFFVDKKEYKILKLWKKLVV